MHPTLLGELASLATAVCWTGSATFFSIASRRLGSVVLNRTRLLLAVVFLLITHTLALGTPLPSTPPPTVGCGSASPASSAWRSAMQCSFRPTC